MWIFWTLLIAAILAVAAFLREFWALWLPLALAIRAQARGRKESACKLYRRVISTPTFLNDKARCSARFRLSWLLMEKGQYADAVELLRTNLQTRYAAALEANVRQRLAEALEGAGHGDEARAERTRAGQLLSGAANDAEKAVSEANTLQKQQRFGEACAAYERGLNLMQKANAESRAKVMTQLGLAAFNAGRPEDAVRWSEQAIALNPGLTILMTALSAAGLGYASRGNLEQSEQHCERAMELATRAGNRDAAARYMMQLAATRRRRGKLAEAMQMCEQAMGMTVTARRAIYAMQYEILCNWGRFEEATTALHQAEQAQGFPTPSAQKRMAAVYACETALLLAERGLPEQAPPHMAKGLEGLRNDTKTSVRYQAGNIWICALLSQREVVRTESARIETCLASFAEDRATQRIMLAALGRAWAVLDDPARSIVYWQQFQGLEPDPIAQPKGYYYIGECLHRLGDLPAAKAALQKAIDLNIDSHDSARARKLLAVSQQEENVGAR